MEIAKKKNRRYMIDGSARSDAACAIAERLGTGTYNKTFAEESPRF